MGTVIVGIGNPVLSDDSVGLKSAAALRTRLAGREDITISELCSGGLALMEALVGYRRAIVIDAIVSGEPAGSIHQLRPADLPFTRTIHSTHAGTFPEALELGRTAGLRLPLDIRIWAVEAADVETIGEELTPAVGEAVPRVVEQILSHLSAEEQ
jgi:hydrogenase maturation protease